MADAFAAQNAALAKRGSDMSLGILRRSPDPAISAAIERRDDALSPEDQAEDQLALAQGRYGDVRGWYDTPEWQRRDILVGTGYGIPTAEDQKLAVARMTGMRRF